MTSLPPTPSQGGGVLLPPLWGGLGWGLLLFLCPALLSAQTGNGVSVSNLVVTAGSPASVTFNMSWKAADMPAIKWSDTVWVFVDHNVNGKMERLDVIDATVSAGSIVKSLSPGNTKGVFVAGYARSAGAGGYSATVTLSISQADVAGACAYVSNYRPVAEYNSGVYEFTGTPNYRLELKLPGGSTVYTSSSSPFYLPAGYTLLSFTDATGAPGIINCIQMTGGVNFTVAPSVVVKGQPSTFTVNEFTTTPVATALSFTWSATGFNPVAGSGTAYMPTSPGLAATYPVKLTASSEGYCDITVSKDVQVIDCVPSSTFNLLASASGFCAGGSGVTLSLSGTESGRNYQLYKDGVPEGNLLAGTGAAATFTGTFKEGVYTARAVQKGSYCEVVMNGSHTITSHLAPTAPVISKPDDKCLNGGDLVFTVTQYSGVVGWRSVDGGSIASNNLSVTFLSPSTGTKSVTAYTAQTYTNAPTCYSTDVSQSATVHALPTVNSTAGASRCGGGTVTLTATHSEGVVIDWYSVSANGSVLANGTGTNSFTTPSINTSTTYYAQARNTSTGCVSATRLAVAGTVLTAPSAPTGLTPDIATICSGVNTSIVLTINGGNVGSGAVYEWGTGTTAGNNPLSPATTTASTRTVTTSVATTYWARLKGTGACSATTTNGVTASITTYGAISPGSITTASTTTKAGTAPGVTVQSASLASGGSGNLTYLWVRTGGTSAVTLTGRNAATYGLDADAANYAAAGTYYFNRYAKDVTCSTAATVASSGTYTLGVEATGTNQPQGSCTFTQPAVVGTFAAFPSTYSASTYVTLTDERDSKNYTVVQIGGRWIMAQNLNYQSSLTWTANSNQPTTSYGGGVTALIGHFWCPGGYSSSTGTSTLASCNVWGALYSWETAMMVDGKWTSSEHNSSAWTEPSSYHTASGSGGTLNHARSDAGATTNGRGICPENWHVPTDGEWGDILNEMETSTKNHNTSTGWIGANAGSRGKSVCTVADNKTTGATYVSDTQANWYYYASTLGTDVYGFRVLPAGRRGHNGSAFHNRGLYAYSWSSSAGSSTNAWCRSFYYGYATVRRGNGNGYGRSYGFSVRCIRDL